MGKFYLQLFVLIIFFLFNSCKNSSQPKFEDKSLQYYDKESDEIDINRDDIPDLKREIRFYQFVSGTTVQYYIKPINEAEILCDTKNNPIRLMANDTVFYIPKQNNVIWYPDMVNMMICDYYYENWLGSWADSQGIIGVKVRKDSTYQTSWVNLTLDTLREKNIIFNYSRYQEDTESAIIVK